MKINKSSTCMHLYVNNRYLFSVLLVKIYISQVLSTVKWCLNKNTMSHIWNHNVTLKVFYLNFICKYACFSVHPWRYVMKLIIQTINSNLDIILQWQVEPSDIMEFLWIHTRVHVFHFNITNFKRAPQIHNHRPVPPRQGGDLLTCWPDSSHCTCVFAYI